MIFSGSSSSAYASLSTPMAGLSAATGLSCSARSRWEPRRLFRRKSFWAAIRSSSSRRRRSCSWNFLMLSSWSGVGSTTWATCGSWGGVTGTSFRSGTWGAGTGARFVSRPSFSIRR
uniref:(northern house mosquito) hypothetical protein n=1 Tax=Culex pipiens TaxID=7175 RepID=A0A8D8P549_CULPI